MDSKSEPQLQNTAVPVKKESQLSAPAGDASLLIGLQVVSRALTFIVNQLILQHLSPELLGISTQLEVYSMSILFFARESLRVAIQREGDVDDEGLKNEDDEEVIPPGHVDSRTAAGRTQVIVNLSYISIFLGAIFAIGLAILYTRTLRSGDPTVLETPYFSMSLKLYGLAAFWELLSEPAFVVVQQKSRFKIRASAEASATVLKCLVTYGSAIWAARNHQDIGVLPFALGQVAYSVTLFLVYCWSVWNIATLGGFSLIMTPIYSKDSTVYIFSYFSRPLLALGRSLFAQSIVKHVLAQGDTLLISTLASQRAQGVYALAANYGGLVARLLLQPVEESSRNYFAKLLSSTGSKPSKETIMKARTNLQTLLRAYVLFSIFVVAVGPTIAPLLLKIVVGSKWTSSGAGHVLATFCYYIPLMAINGMTEAFVTLVATESEVNRQSVWMLAFSAGFGGAAYVFLRLLNMGAEGLVWANSLNMIFRIIWSFVFISSYLARNGTTLDIGTLIPRPMTIAAGVGTYAIMAQLETTFTGGMLDLLKSGVVAALFVVILAISEREYLFECYRSLRGQNDV